MLFSYIIKYEDFEIGVNESALIMAKLDHFEIIVLI